ncbi:MAG: hypothetical protein ACK4M1_04360 [Flavobacterium sp.]
MNLAFSCGNVTEPMSNPFSEESLLNVIGLLGKLSTAQLWIKNKIEDSSMLIQ